ncbi:MAG: zinc metallopeptidase [Defluviitaleaceae bacterium]|nr:zinc metallopeptidase [Defluviitaleaceae bacterium]
MFFDPLFIIMILPPMFLAMWAQSQVKGNYVKYSKLLSRRGMTGAQVAEELLSQNGIKDVKVEQVQGELTDHYDPRSKTIRLSQGIYGSTSVAALSIAAHEAGHAVQHDTRYAPLSLRSAILPVASIGSNAGIWLFMIGIMLAAFAGSPFAEQMMLAGIVLFSAAVAFQLITLPVEFDASKRAISMLEEYNFLDESEIKPAKAVLRAAALTYVAAAAIAMAHLLRFILIFAGRRND